MKPEALHLKTQKKILVIILMSLYSSFVFCQFSGTYTIGESQNYATFTEALEALASSYVSGPTVFNVISGTYTEQFTIPYIPNASETNTVTFQSLTGNAADVVIQFDATGNDDNFVLKIKDNSFLSIRNMSFVALDPTYGNPITIENYAFNLTIEGCRLVGTPNTNAVARNALIMGEGVAIQDLLIFNNSFSDGSFGIYLNCTTDYNLRSNIYNNTFDNLAYCAINLLKNDYTTIAGNSITRSLIGLKLTNSSSNISIHSNKLESISNTGFYFSNLKSVPNYEINIYNNSISLSEAGTIALDINNCSYLNLYHNTCLVTKNNYLALPKVINLNYCSSQTINLVNNNFVSLHSGYALYSLGADQIKNCDYNNFYTPSTNFAYWGENCEDFRSLKNISGKNEHSVFAFPNFLSEANPVPNSAWLDNAGTPIDFVLKDIDGNDRNAEHPDIGAFEFDSDPNTKPAMHGVFTIGAGADYSSLNAAMTEINIRGIDDTLRLQFLPGYYNEQCKIYPVTGASSKSPLIIESSTNNSNDIHLWYNAENADDNYILSLIGASFVQLKDLSMHAMDSKYARILKLTGMVDSLYIQDCSLIGTVQNDANYDAIIIDTDYLNFHYQLIENDSLLHGSTAIQYNLTYYLAAPGEFLFRDNYLENSYQNIYIRNIPAVFIHSNRMLSNTYGLNLNYINSALEIEQNYIYSKRGGSLDLSSIGFEDFVYGKIINNFLMSDYSSPNKNALRIYSCNHLNLYYNSVSMVSQNNDHVPGNIQNSQYINLKNNIFYNNSNAYSFYTNNTTFSSANYNCFYSPAINLAYWNGVCANLAAIQTASGSNLQSLMAFPGFVSEIDLHTNSPLLDGAGTPVAGITIDIDGQNRDILSPDIGADEFGVIVNQSPYVDKAIPDQEFEWNSGSHEIAFLDTVFLDPDPADVLSYSVSSSEGWVLAGIQNKILKLTVSEGSYGTSKIIVTAKDPQNASAADTFLVKFYITENNPPVALNDTVITAIPLIIDVLTNDYDEDGDDILIENIIYTGTASASISASSKSLIYDPAGVAGATDTIVYIITDGNGGRDTASVFISIYLVMEDFYDVETNLSGLSHGSIRWGDYDNDGDLDLLQTGWTGSFSNFETRIITNTGDGFENSGIALTGLSAGTANSAAWVDFDNDNDLDIIITGRLDENELEKRSLLYENIGGNFYHVENSGLENVTSSSVSPADVNHDGITDILLSGSGDNGNFTRIQMNAGTGFAPVNTELPGTSNGVALLVDLDNDGEHDVFMCGSGINPCKVYISGPDAYTEYATIIPTMYNASADFADIDKDGDLDLAIMGTDGTNRYLQIYLNQFDLDYQDGFSLYGSYRGMHSGELAWVDVENDGDLDLSVTGNSTGLEVHTFILKNNEGIFEEVNFSLKDLGRSSLDWGDYDNDGDLDLAIQGIRGTGGETHIYRNDNQTVNNPPVMTDNLSTSKDGNFLTLSWAAATDDISPSNSLNYNVRFGSTSKGTDIISPMSEGQFLKTPQYGNAGHHTSMKLTNLEPGEYYWSVQAIDQSYAASYFTAEAYLVLTGMEENVDDNTISIYPNPAEDKVWIYLPENGDYRIKIYELSGRMVLEEEFTQTESGQHEITLDNLSSGVYLININDRNKNSRLRLIVN
ncbi:MAG: FG-GAP-like repeat-containing protein [Bacteroidales bacterium]|nr:FG-GAP-like repeat-containing protein [Bacteroidales bacterium]MCF8389988.1 FG-GAP-like repeat-containing protein [Bacteroidales bacterium]